MTSTAGDARSLTRPALGPLLCRATGDDRWRRGQGQPHDRREVESDLSPAQSGGRTGPAAAAGWRHPGDRARHEARGQGAAGARADGRAGPRGHPVRRRGPAGHPLLRHGQGGRPGPAGERPAGRVRAAGRSARPWATRSATAWPNCTPSTRRRSGLADFGRPNGFVERSSAAGALSGRRARTCLHPPSTSSRAWLANIPVSPAAASPTATTGSTTASSTPATGPGRRRARLGAVVSRRPAHRSGHVPVLLGVGLAARAGDRIVDPRPARVPERHRGRAAVVGPHRDAPRQPGLVPRFRALQVRGDHAGHQGAGQRGRHGRSGLRRPDQRRGGPQKRGSAGTGLAGTTPGRTSRKDT